MQGTDISIPTDVTNADVKRDLMMSIAEGTYTVGDLIVPQKFEKLVVNSDCAIEIKEFEIFGRKIPVDEIRNKQYMKRKYLYRIFAEDEIMEMSISDIVKELARINEFNNSDVNVDTITLKEKFCKFNAT